MLNFWPFQSRKEVETSAWYRTVEILRNRANRAERKEEEWRARALDAELKIEQMQEQRRKLDRRIHNQRVALRETWQIVEMRRKWAGSETARRMYASLLKRYLALKEASPRPRPESPATSE